MTTNNPTLQTTPTDDQFTNNGGRVDAVYIVATPGEIAFIKPMIAMRNGSQSGATLYASSRSAQGTAGPDFRLEMEGLQYSEIPMLAGGNLPLMQQALSAVNVTIIRWLACMRWALMPGHWQIISLKCARFRVLKSTVIPEA